MSRRETNYEKFNRYSHHIGIELDADSNLKVSFEGGTYETLKFVGEFVASLNELTVEAQEKMSKDFKDYPDKFTVRIYKHPKGGEVFSTRVDGDDDKIKRYNYFESMAEMGMLFGGTFRYVLFEKTLSNTLHSTTPGQYA